MKILQVISSLHTGGAEKLMVDLLPRMKSEGHQVELCVFDGTKTAFYIELQKQGITIHDISSPGGIYSPLCAVKLIRLMRNGWDIVHTHTTAPQLFAAIGSMFCKTHLVTTEHNTTNKRRHLSGYKPIDKWMFSRYEKHVMISDQCEFNHIEYLGKRNVKNLVKIYNGIDYNKFSNAAPATDVRQLGSRIIVFVASFRPQKDQPTLIRAMEYLPDYFHLCLVGGGNDERKAIFESMIKKHGLDNRVHLLGIRNDIPEILAASDYVVMCSHFEGLSLSSLEGMASGKPFLASDVDGLHEIVNGNGILFRHEDAKDFADSIMKLEDDENFRKSIIEKCKIKASKYDIGIMTRQYLDVYEQLLAVT